MKLKRISILLLATSLFLVGCGESPAPTPQHVHVWGDPTYTWSSDNCSCLAKRICELDATHIEEENGNSKYKVIREATETSEGLATYTVTFNNQAFATQSKDVVIPMISDVDTYEKALTSVFTKHNYSAHLNNQWANETKPFIDYNFYNIDNNAMFDDLNPYFYSGYIKQKGQGIVSFQLNKEATTSSGLILGNFVATNVERNVSDIYTLAVEHLADKEFTYDSELGMYKSTSMDAIAVLANLGFGDYTSLVSAPEYITANFEDHTLTYTGIFEITYFDVVEVHTTGEVTLEVTNFEKTHNSVIESYVVTPDYAYEAPTGWDSDTIALLKQEFNNVIPPYIEGMSYAWKAGQGVSEGFYVAMVEDYFGGDLTTKYRTALVEAGFHEVTNLGLIEYQMVVEEEFVIHTYSVKMKYYAPSDKDSSKMEYGYLYPNGVSSFKFLHKQKTKQTIVTVDLLNQFIGSFAAGAYLPSFSFAGDTRVANVHDATSSDETLALLLKGTDGAFFRIYAKTKDEAVSAVEKYIDDLKKLGFSGSSSQVFQQYWMHDEHYSVVKITDPSYATSWSSTSYLQVSIEISLATLESWQKENITLDSFSVFGQSSLFTV